MGSPLDFASSEVFRQKLIVRNLVPYVKSPTKATPPINYETIQRDLTPTDSDDTLIDNPVFAAKAYPLNQYGASGGYKQVRDPNTLQNTNSNEGEYDYSDARLIDEAPKAAQTGFPGISPAWQPLNLFDPPALIDGGQYVSLDEILGKGQRAQQYPTFVPSIYRSVNILLQNDPVGSNGLASQDSFIVQLGSKLLKEQFEKRIAANIRRNTIGRANFLNGAGGSDIFGIILGRAPILEPIYNITQSSAVLGAAADFINRVSGSYAPYSTIPGDYFDSSINRRLPMTTQQLSGAYAQANLNSGIGRFFGRLLGSPKSGSILFLQNTGSGTKNLLFQSLDYNLFKPAYTRTFFDNVRGALRGATENDSNYYIGSPKSEPGDILSPQGDLPTDSFGGEIQSPVYGPQEIAQLYEGPSKAIKLGANGPTYSSGGDIMGGFTWTSPKYKGNAGKKVGLGGENIAEDPDFPTLNYSNSESTNFQFKNGSILDDTQRLINSQPRGGRRLQHVGNAIDQVSKVFNDGYKEITKGSKVIRYVGELGVEKGAEYCRIFQKDTPYLQYNDLQKQDGITKSGRKFAYSILDNTYNLNIAPMKGDTSTNIFDGRAQKYMFSIENLAWRTSNRPGLTWSDLPVCERGPNGGRVMWFPPYGLTFSETVTPSFKPTDFIGRPEPVYTYSNTSRSGTLGWKIVVDHPSVLNLIVNRVLASETLRERAQGLLDSFFAGCKKYDLYELAEKYYQVNPDDLREIQERIVNQTVTTEDVRYITNTVQTGADSTNANGVGNGAKDTNAPPTKSQTVNVDDFKKYENYALYFDNDIPLKGQSVEPYNVLYNTYVAQQTKQEYQEQSNEKQQVALFFNDIVESNKSEIKQMLLQLSATLENNLTATANIIFSGSASMPQSETYNVSLSERRIQSVIEYIKLVGNLGEYVATKRLTFGPSKALGEQTTVTPRGPSKSYGEQNCQSAPNDSLALSTQKYSVRAMACRRVVFGNIEVKAPPPIKPPSVNNQQSPRYQENVTTEVSNRTVTKQVVETQEVLRDNITKRVLRLLLSECDYFELIKQETPMVFDNLREKLKFFHPAFHSITPEGLNSRLTFLQQCMRPGDTIPTIRNDVNGATSLEYNNAVNTSFGTPPVLILRVGDFWHSKIIPTSLQLGYEELDLNPEGIGVQPMIATVTMGFNFVGGQGLKTAVDKLQNALSFNYYANTEIYDDRSDVTDLSYKVLDKQFIENIGFEVNPPTVSDVENPITSNNNETVGKVLTSVITDGIQRGTIEYGSFMNSFVTQTQTYFQTVINKNRDVLRQYNNGVRQMLSYNRNYTDGGFVVDGGDPETNLFGKPVEIEKQIDEIFADYIQDINSGNDTFIQWIESKNFSQKAVRQIKDNYRNFVTNKRGSFQNALTSIIQELVNTQQAYLQTLNRANVITIKPAKLPDTPWGTDGLQNTTGEVTIYNYSGTSAVSATFVGNTKEELVLDIQSIAVSLRNFMTALNTQVTLNSGKKGYIINPEKPPGVPYNTITDSKYWDEQSNKYQYFILSTDVVDTKLYDTFKAAIIENVVNNTTLHGNGNIDFATQFDGYWIARQESLGMSVRQVYINENTAGDELITQATNTTLKDYIIYRPFQPLTKTRVMDYIVTRKGDVGNEPEPYQIDNVRNLGLKTNANTDKLTWNSIDGNITTGKVQML